ncbi:hypothetical protein Esi_0133_0034 [Ectocarpus siliculosus]|uniref:Uncharacterized protein n=1 Tax=Ectocarpus siliculosus TaxID=2880 RepID=D7FJD7_ECTSI|nr:hypothetical protein Esi_0133_0034 [Ectocarpus siliculosus]|eukprot:CBJ29040.1 hypothetical protein Esi_0133_0034 [Ectocarpus siliculosus]
MRGQAQQLTAGHEACKKDLAASESGEDAGSPGEDDANVRDQYLLPEGLRGDRKRGR